MIVKELTDVDVDFGRVIAAGGVGDDDEMTCALHFMSSVGVETTQVASPPSAPAIKVVVSDGCGTLS